MQAPLDLEIVAGAGPGKRLVRPGLDCGAFDAVHTCPAAGRTRDSDPKRGEDVAARQVAEHRCVRKAAAEEHAIVRVRRFGCCLHAEIV